MPNRPQPSPSSGTVRGRSVGEFPWDSRPCFWALRGAVGCGQLGLWGSPARNTFDDLMVTYPSTVPGDAGDVALANYIRSGFGGSVPRPEITGNDMRDLIYFIRRSTLAGSYPTPVNPGPDISVVMLFAALPFPSRANALGARPSSARSFSVDR